MKLVFVGQSDGRRQIKWGAALLASSLLGIVSAAVAVGVYFMLTRTFSVPCAVFGFFGPFISIGVGIQRARQLPLEQLTPLDHPSG